MRCNIKRIILFTLVISMLMSFNSFAVTIESTGLAPVINYDMRSAHKNAINAGLLSAIRSFYSNSNTANMPDVSYDFIKFVNKYTIKATTVEDNIINVTLSVDLDDVGLKDVHSLSAIANNTAVFAVSGIDQKILPQDRVKSIITSLLEKEAFSTSEQKSFDYYSSNGNGEDLIDAFSDLSSKYFFDFKISSSFVNLTKPDAKCELTIQTSINVRAGLGSQLQITSASPSSNKKTCIEEALVAGIMSTLDYVRGNLILKKDSNATNTIKIRAKNFASMVDVNNTLNQLKNRGYITNFKTLSFAPKDVLFTVESQLDIKTLNDRVRLVDQNSLIQNEVDSDEIILNFQSK